MTTDGNLTVETISTQPGFQALAPEWDELVRAMPRPSPFMVHAWLTTWLEHYGDRGELAVHVARRGGRLVGALPFYTRPRAGMRVTEFVGGDQSALGDLLVAEGETEAPRLLTAHAERAGQDLADLFGLPGDSRLAAAAGPGRMRLIERVESPVLDLSDGWEAVYRRKTSSKKRNLHKRRRRQLGELGDVTVRVARGIDELLPALEDAFRLHRLRWAGRPDGSRFATPKGVEFHTAAIAEVAKLDMPRIVTLELDGRAIAFHYFFAFCNAMYVHRLAFDPDLARFSPGVVNTLDALAAASDEGLTFVEFLGADERYKVELADRFAPMHQGFGLAGSARGRAAVAARHAGILLRRRLKRARGLRRFYFEGLAPARRAARAAFSRIRTE